MIFFFFLYNLETMEGDLNTTILNLRSTVFASSLNISTSFDNVHSSRTA